MAPAAIAVPVLLSPHLLGGVYPWGMLTVAGMALAALAIVVFTTPGLRMPLLPLCAAMLTALAWTILQALPLPCTWMASIAPEVVLDQTRTRALLDMAEPTLCPMSRDPAATREEIVKGVAIVAAFLATLMAAAHGARDRVLRYVAFSCTVLAASTLAHAGVAAERVYGLYTPLRVAGREFVGPIVNPNSLGGLIAMGVPILLALALSARHPAIRGGAALSAALCAAAALTTRSRGAAAALLVGCAFYGLLELRRLLERRGHRHRTRRALLWRRSGGMLGAIAALVLVSYGFYPVIAEEIAGGGLDKLQLIEGAWRFALERPVLGVGRGAFAAAFVGHSTATARFELAENFPVQWVADWGLPVALLLLSMLVLAFAREVWSARRSLRMGALAGVAALALQNLLDLGFELVGVAVPAVCALAAALVPGGPKRRPLSRWPRRMLIAGIASAALGVIALAPGLIRDHRPSQEAALREALVAGDAAAFARTFRSALLAHPGEPTFPVLGAAEALARNDGSAGRLINRAMQLAPTWAAPHAQAAHWLWRRGRISQALVEVREALARDPYPNSEFMCQVLRLRRDAWEQVMPEGPARLVVLTRAARCLGYHTAEGRAVEALLLREFPREVGPRVDRLRRLLRKGADPEAREALRELSEIAAEDPRVRDLEVRVLHSEGRYREALARMPAARAESEDPEGLWELDARAHAALGDAAGTRRALARLRGFAATGTHQKRIATLAREAELLSAVGDHEGAYQAQRELYDIKSDSAQLRKLAQLAQRAGRDTEARASYRRLCVLEPHHEDACRAARLLPPSGPAINTQGKPSN